MKNAFLLIVGTAFWGLFLGCSMSENKKKEAGNNASQPLHFSRNVFILADSTQATNEDSARLLPQKAPEMTFILGGLTQVGSVAGLPQEQPVFWVKVKPFLMDTQPVTTEAFGKFVQATGYQTEAEKFGDGGVFDEQSKSWALKKGANWQYPQGREMPKAPSNHPVTQVSWNDATAYAKWAGKRLPTEIEWEHAARNARNDRAIYPFGNDITDANQKYRANIWQGHFPDHNEVTDGFRFTSPVGFFGKTPLGLTDMTGNVWQWCEDWKSDYGTWIKGEKAEVQQEKAQRGGSFLCEPGWCHGYRVSGRSFSTPETSLMHVGFRCVRDL